MPNGRPLSERSQDIKNALEGKQPGDVITFDLQSDEQEQFSRFSQRTRTAAKGLAMRVSVRSNRDDRTKALVEVREVNVDPAELAPGRGRRNRVRTEQPEPEPAPAEPEALSEAQAPSEAAAETAPAATAAEPPAASSAEAEPADEAAPTVTLCVTASVSAYKAAEIVRGLQKGGCDVAVAMTPAAERFVGQSTFAALTDTPVAIDLFNWSLSQLPHIDLAEWADLIVVAPASADAIAKIAHGFADDCVCATVLAATSKVMVCPAMNVHMWKSPATQANVATLRERGIMVMEPTEGYLVCGDWGEGKLAPVDGIVRACLDELRHAE